MQRLDNCQQIRRRPEPRNLVPRAEFRSQFLLGNNISRVQIFLTCNKQMHFISYFLILRCRPKRRRRTILGQSSAHACCQLSKKRRRRKNSLNKVDFEKNNKLLRIVSTPQSNFFLDLLWLSSRFAVGR